MSDGRWGQVRIWDAALARAQINDEARHAHCTPLLAFWGFNGRAGDTTMDAGPYRQDLDLSGGYEAKWNDYHEVTWAQQGALSRLSLPSLTPTFLRTFQIQNCSGVLSLALSIECVWENPECVPGGQVCAARRWSS